MFGIDYQRSQSFNQWRHVDGSPAGPILEAFVTCLSADIVKAVPPSVCLLGLSQLDYMAPVKCIIQLESITGLSASS